MEIDELDSEVIDLDTVIKLELSALNRKCDIINLSKEPGLDLFGQCLDLTMRVLGKASAKYK